MSDPRSADNQPHITKEAISVGSTLVKGIGEVRVDAYDHVVLASSQRRSHIHLVAQACDHRYMPSVDLQLEGVAECGQAQRGLIGHFCQNEARAVFPRAREGLRTTIHLVERTRHRQPIN